ncbi:RNA polymerase sigma factor [Desulfoscipio gibsoniae]
MLDGDQDAFRLLINEYKNLVYAICFNAVHDPFEAENLAQETFLQVYKSLPKYEFRGLKTWISRIALNKSIDYKRKLLAKKNRETISLADIELVADESTPVQDIIIREEERLLLAEALSRIPEHYAAVLRKNYLANRSPRQIAEEENISIRTVETRLYRGKKILREQFEELSKNG